MSTTTTATSTTLSEAYRDPSPHLQHSQNVPLDFHSIQTLPESHTWPQMDEPPHGAPIDPKSQIPIVDLSDPRAVELVGQACQTWGAFQVTKHGLPLSLLEDVESQARRLFSLPLEHKLRALRSPGGATGYGVARISPFFPKFMWHEGFTMMGPSVHDHARELWSHDYEHFCNIMDEYQKKVKALSFKLLLIILKSLETSEEEEEEEEDMVNWATSLHDSQGALQLNSYPPCPDPDHAIGLVPHTDSLLFTVLHQSHDVDNALQIFREGLGWVSVPPVPGALVINVGDLLHILSNARYPSVYHRAVVNPSRHRISVAYFYGPSADSVIEPLSKIEFPRYRSLVVKEYIGLKSKHLHNALSLIRI